MKKFILILLVALVSNTYAQKNKTYRPIDDKYSTIDKQVEYILEKNSNINIKTENNVVNTTKDNIIQFTDDDLSDIELFAAINPTDSNNIVISWMNMDPTNSSMPLLFYLYGGRWRPNDCF